MGTGASSGYYQTVPVTIQYTPTAGTSTASTVSFTQNLAIGTAGATTRSTTQAIWWDMTRQGAVPALTIKSVTPIPTKLSNICGTTYFGGSYGFSSVGITMANMGTNLTRANPVTVSVASITNAPLFTSFTNPIPGSATTVTSGDIVASMAGYTSGYSLTVTGTNLHGVTGSASVSGLPVIDPLGTALWSAVSVASPPVMTTSYQTGKRITTTGMIGGSPTATAFSDSASLATAEAIISQGYFCVPSYSGAYINYPYGANYSGITTGSGGFTAGYRYATLQWNKQAAGDVTTYGAFGVEIRAPAGKLTLAQNGNSTNLSSPTLSYKLYDLSNNLIDIYFRIKKTDATWTGWYDLNASTGAATGAQSTATDKIPTFTPGGAGGEDLFDFTAVLPGIQSTSVDTLVIAVGGMGCAPGSAFKFSARYKIF